MQLPWNKDSRALNRELAMDTKFAGLDASLMELKESSNLKYSGIDASLLILKENHVELKNSLIEAIASLRMSPAEGSRQPSPVRVRDGVLPKPPPTTRFNQKYGAHPDTVGVDHRQGDYHLMKRAAHVEPGCSSVKNFLRWIKYQKI
ncbi:hypothetical protein O6P43_026369 [Quillaja saponaria]|uniref:Uncharacterized protein n=1 Tax=Quillaja saponaria TaxID=32244 RepID=A0AAD7PC71_QUISA|nr:hypothetical protein O6P43_026369 [Quillaja saponaria]